MDHRAVLQGLERQMGTTLPSTVTSCQSELQELMRQIDIMVNSKKAEWERELQAVQVKLDVRDKEVLMQRATLEAKHQEIGNLRQQLEGFERAQRDLVAQYEQQVSGLRNELTNLKTKYEKLQRHQLKRSSGSSVEKDRLSAELKDSRTEIEALRGKVEDYRGRGKDWDSQRRSLQGQIQSLEAQRKTLAEKCEHMQQQSLSYQSQLNKRRQMLESVESTHQVQLAQVGEQLERARDDINMQDETIERLKSELDDTISSKDQLLGENEQLREELRKATRDNRRLEDEVKRLNLELQSRDDLIQAAERDQKNHSKDLSRLEESLHMKDKLIRSLEDATRKEEAAELNQLREELSSCRSEARACRKNEQRLREEVDRLQASLQSSQTEVAHLNTELTGRIQEIRRLEGTVVRELQTELDKSQGRLVQEEQSHTSEVEGMRAELSNLTADLHQRDVSIAELSEKSSHMERQLRDTSDRLDRKGAELQVTMAQLEALRLENRHLRELTQDDQRSASKDLRQAEVKITELQGSYSASVAKLEEENLRLREDVSAMRDQLELSEQTNQEKYSAALRQTQRAITDLRSKEDRRVRSIQEESDRKLRALQDKLDNTIGRYEQELDGGRRRRGGSQSDSVVSFRGADGTHTASPMEHIWATPTRKDSQGRESPYISGMESPGPSRPESRASVAARFLAEEEKHGLELERKLDSHITEFKDAADRTIKKYSAR
ncbi:centrosomal protein of 63 kDa-like isoform X1 [Branchiostoma lanceolatum]|uniref:centrosomal protein of 63 kDa-like isoform X1 n=1 Tax=Branchiostoma lanceolatum TaxID=7740 RepID=UPI00345583DD